MDPETTQRLKEYEEKRDKAANEKLAKLDEEFPLEDRILAVTEMKAKERLEKEIADLEEYEVKKTEERSKFINQPILLREITDDEVKKVWIWETLIAKGHITLISASPKDGKSTFIRCFLKALLNEEELAGE